jgi:hypothetical protein
MTYNYNTMSDAQLDSLLDLKRLDDSPEAGAIVEELETRQLLREYNPAYTVRVYFATGDDTSYGAMRNIAKRIKSDFTFHRVWGLWEGDIETSCVAEFIHNPRQVAYTDAIKDTLKLASALVRDYKQEAAVVTCDGLTGGGRQWLVEKES